jgi:hypothetical protein
MHRYSVSNGDVIVVRTSGLAAEVIRLGERIQGKPDLHNHVAVVYNVGPGGILAIEGRPGGVGWVDAARYLDSPWSVTNFCQPKTEVQRRLVCAAMHEMALKKTPYDWQAIADDAASALRIPDVFREPSDWGNFPGHVVCSSVAAWAYQQAGLAHPEPCDCPHVEPGDWDSFIRAAGWSDFDTDPQGKDLHPR